MEHPFSKLCPVCSSKDRISYMSIKDLFLSQEEFGTFRCASCDLVYVDRVPHNLSDYYKSEEYISHKESSSPFSKLYAFIQGVTFRQKSSIVKSNTGGKRILDFGAGKGDFVSYLNKLGFSSTGYEPDPDARAVALVKNNLKLIDSLDEISSNSFDLITLWHVLEHVTDPNRTLQDLHRLLTNQGVLVVAVPNRESFDADYYKEYWAAYDVPRHLLHFNPDSLKVLANKNGFSITSIHPMLFDSTYVSLLSEKLICKSKGTNISIFQQFRALLIGTISNLLLLRNKNRCSSLIYVLNKQ